MLYPQNQKAPLHPMLSVTDCIHAARRQSTVSNGGALHAVDSDTFIFNATVRDNLALNAGGIGLHPLVLL
jgi:hypothetical protein